MSKKLIYLASVFVLMTVTRGFSQNLVNIQPDTVTQGQYVKIAITGKNTNFKSISSANSVVFVKNIDLKIFADSLEIKNDTFMYGYFQIPYSFSGNFDLVINAIPVLTLTKSLFIKTQSIVPEISFIDPDTVYQGTFFSFRIYGKNTHFMNCSYFRVWFIQFYDDGITVLNDSVAEVSTFFQDKPEKKPLRGKLH